jgi:hypothetical protein
VDLILCVRGPLKIRKVLLIQNFIFPGMLIIYLSKIKIFGHIHIIIVSFSTTDSLLTLCFFLGYLLLNLNMLPLPLLYRIIIH